MVETTIHVDGQEVRLRASAAVPRLYRIKFGRDIIHDIDAVQQALARERGAQEGDEVQVSRLPMEALEMFEDMAYIMAKHADPQGVPRDVTEWMERFQVFSIYQIFPVLMALWQGNLESLAEAKKKLEQ